MWNTVKPCKFKDIHLNINFNFVSASYYTDSLNASDFSCLSSLFYCCHLSQLFRFELNEFVYLFLMIRYYIQLNDIK